MVEPVAGLAAQLLCFDPPHPREILQEGLAEGLFERFYVVLLNMAEKITIYLTEQINFSILTLI